MVPPAEESRTWATSLSPRPDSVIITVEPAGKASVPALRATQATAWADSSAGMIPSVWLSKRNASSTSSSPAVEYSARPIAARWACSGPRPG